GGPPSPPLPRGLSRSASYRLRQSRASAIRTAAAFPLPRGRGGVGVESAVPVGRMVSSARSARAISARRHPACGGIRFAPTTFVVAILVARLWRSGDRGRPGRVVLGQDRRHHVNVARPGRHSHGHAHDGPRVEVSGRTRRIVIAILVPAAVLTAIALIMLWPGQAHVATQGAGDQQPAYGNVVSVTERPRPPGGGAVQLGPMACGSATVHLT